MIRAAGLEKRYGDKRVLRGIDFGSPWYARCANESPSTARSVLIARSGAAQVGACAL